ncbi:hypothetical protein KDW20_32445 [Burkholderia cenocepacia]|uniref:Wadjet anti-phage system protein JetA family protein n=1 Tax=Burkholderia cenocepacia TaxID=95486 RepID=UPI001589504C|nr:Wadjet anti-phage system protein JetA family protein [Burkholderia cenocepacia]MBR8380493.1 hypothetical protein [Burkholderia cenocepacia]MBR8415059.1 hypothetical protein [Burkholderia cenocepacia]MDS0849639.1 DUF5716 family protein [Burkholderia cenocepacia]
MSATNLDRLAGTAASLLFQRLPDRIFAPLAATNRQRYWTLLCLLHKRRFGPDAPLPPMEGFPARDITADIEEALAEMDDWRDEEDAAPVTDLNIRANMVLQSLVDAGWLKVGRQAFEKRLLMAPAVNHFLSQLVTFAETGPLFVAGKIRSIELMLKDAIEREEGSSLMEAAETTRNLLEHVRNTGTSIRDLMDRLDTDVPTREYVHTFFNEYIEDVFIGDYKLLRTQDHPLTRRSQILDQVGAMCANEKLRDALIAWYQARRADGNVLRATRMFERDVDRLYELSRIDEYLERLDDEIRRANKRALVYLDYRLRSLRPLDDVIQTAIQQITDSSASGHRTAMAPGYLISPTSLAEPRRPVVRAPADALRNRAPSYADIARAELMVRARNSRTMTAPKLAAWVLEWLDGGDRLESDEIPIESIEALRAWQTLAALALPMSSNSRHLYATATSLARGFRVRFSDVEEKDHKYVGGQPFSVVRNRRKI